MEVYKGDFIFAGGCEYEKSLSSGKLIYRIPQYTINKNHFFLIRHSKIQEIVSSKENRTNWVRIRNHEKKTCIIFVHEARLDF